MANTKSNKTKFIIFGLLILIIILTGLGLFLFKDSIFKKFPLVNTSINTNNTRPDESVLTTSYSTSSVGAVSVDSYLAFAKQPLSVMITNLESDLISCYVRVRFVHIPKIWSPQWEINGQTYQHLSGPGEFYIELSPYPQDDLLYNAKYLRVFKWTFTQEDIKQGSVRITYDPEQSRPNQQTHPEITFITSTPYPIVNIIEQSALQFNYTAEQLLQEINQYRNEQGIPILKVHPYLCEAIADVVNLININQLDPNQAFELAMQENPPADKSLSNVRLHFGKDHYDLNKLIQSWLENDDQVDVPLLKDGAYKYTCIVTYSRYVILLAGF